jgi:hypothetical protein
MTKAELDLVMKLIHEYGDHCWNYCHCGRKDDADKAAKTYGKIKSILMTHVKDREEPNGASGN